MVNYLRTVPLLLSALILVHAHTVRANELANLFQDSVVFTNVGYASGSDVVSNFPLRVDISISRPYGFDYNLAGVKAADLRFNFYDEFLDNSTNAVLDVTVDYCITNWDAEGISTLYVNLPRFNNSDKARLTMYWHPVDYAELPVNSPLEVPAAVTNAERSAAWNQAVTDQSTNEDYIACGPAYRRVQEHGAWVTKLVNYWVVEPTISKRQWKQGEDGATVVVGASASASAAVTVEYFDRNTSVSLGEVQPLTPGAYRAVVTVAADDEYAELAKSLDFDIISAVKVGGDATVDDFRHHVTFSLSGDTQDVSPAAHFNYLKTADGQTKAVSTYDYKTEIKETMEVSLACWFRVNPEDVGNQPGDSADGKRNVRLLSLASYQQGRGPLAIGVDNLSTFKLSAVGQGLKDGAYVQKEYFKSSDLRTVVGDGKWHFVAATRSGSSGVVSLYLDGELLGSGSASGEPFYDDNAVDRLAIGCSALTSALSASFVGQIAEAQVYNVAIGLGTVREIYQGRMRLSGKENGLIAYFPLNDKLDPWAGTGATLADKNKNGSKHDIITGGSIKWEQLASGMPFHGAYDPAISAQDTSLVADFNLIDYELFYEKGGKVSDDNNPAVADWRANRTKAMSSYTYQKEIEEKNEVSIGCWFRMDPEGVGMHSGLTAYYNHVALVSLHSIEMGALKGPLSITLNNTKADRTQVLVQGQNIARESIKYSVDLRDGAWHFVMATRSSDSGTASLYFDGVKVASGAAGAAMYASGTEPGHLSIGQDPGAMYAEPMQGYWLFPGSIAEAQVYNKMLDADTVRDLYENKTRLSGKENGLIAYFPLNDKTAAWTGTGAVLADKNQNLPTHDITTDGRMRWRDDVAAPFRGAIDVLNDKPFLVRIAPDSPKGFFYEDLVFGATPEAFYSDVRFFSETGEPLDYVIDTWDTSGESYIWVKVKKFSADTKVTMCWGQGAYVTLPDNDPDSVWPGGTTDMQKEKLRQYFLNNYEDMVKIGRVFENAELRLQNRWIVPPSMSMTQWAPGETVPTVVPGTTYGGRAKVSYWDRSTGRVLSSMPADQVGEYRAIFHFSETALWSSLETSIDFRIVREVVSHDLGDVSTRVLLANDDGSIAGGEVCAQSYDDNEDGWGTPYWTHHGFESDEDVSDFDPTRLFADFNLFAGTHHEYMSGTNRIWGLENVRFGNLFNNGRYSPDEFGDDGLRSGQNYLPWNPASFRMLGYEGLEVGDRHRHAGTFVMQNVCDDRMKRYAQICSPCYDDGIGTIYFDVVNAFTGNVRDEDGEPNYAIVVEVATNIVGYVTRPPVDAIYPDGICSSYDFYFYGDWRPVEMIPIRFRDDTGTDVTDCERLAPTKELVLDVEDGGSRKNFYRVYVPVNLDCQARFRIRRTRIDRTASLNPDADAFIIVDNLICSPARDMVTLVPYGWFDGTKRGKQWLGQEMAFDPAFPGVGDAVYGRVLALDRNGDEVPAGSVTAVSMHYRWTYLNQAKTDWALSDFYPDTLRSISPLVLPAGLPGDVEFWFEGSQNSGYYSYANYSGTKIGVPWYSEAYALVTNGWDGASTEWSVRLREGRSDLEESVLVVREPSGAVKEFQMALVEDHQWRGYYMTTNPIPEGVDVRVEFRNREEPGEKVWSWNTNRYCLATSKELTLPYSGRMTECGTNGWTRIPVDAYTGYIMFQADDSTFGLSVVRADYQNFNHWTDGHGSVFVGSAADDANLPVSGVSPLVRDFYADYTTNQVAALATNQLWNLDFGDALEYDYYRTFAAGDRSVNGWPLGKGRFVYGLFRDPKCGTALQMAGCGEGYVEFSDPSVGLWPRGVEKVTFSARLAQSVGFDDFSYYDDGARLQDYCFSANGAFDLDDNKSFTGNASLSLVGYYRRGKGCYEMRWEQETGNVDGATGIVHGPNSRGQRLVLYRWNRNGSGGYDQTELFSIVNSTTFQFNMPTVGAGSMLASGNFMPMRIALYEYTKSGKTGTMIVACVHAAGSAKGGDKWRYAAYFDCSEQRLTSGSYGVLTANSGGYFVNPQYGVINNAQSLAWSGLTLPSADAKTNSGNGDRSFPLTINLNSCKDDLFDMWVTVPGRNEAFVQGSVCGFKAADVGQTVSLVASKRVGGIKYDTELATYSLTNYWGTLKVKEEFGGDKPLIWRTEDAVLRLRTGGDLDGIRTDVVIDDVSIHQWRGRNEIVLYRNDGSENSPDNANDSKDPAREGDPDNYVYTSGWVKGTTSGNTALELSARRTIPGRPVGVRTPLMDGYAGRGSGIGNIEFHYRNCQTNTALLVQIATNVYRGNLLSLTKDVYEGDGNATTWATVTRLTYDQLGEAGSTNIAFGIRKAAGDNGCIARVIIDPALVSEVAGVEDETAFGSIELLKVMCQDEPPIDKGCWWGWNVRTLGNAEDTEKRMYLPDGKEEPVGYSMALNNSTMLEVIEEKKREYGKHMPFLQSPSFTNSDENVIGEVSFRARKYENSGYSQYAEVAVYGITLNKMNNADDTDWELLTRFVISNTVFTTYSYRAIDDGKYCAIRLGVTGVPGVQNSSRGPTPICGETPVRVLIDEVTISEAVNPELSIRNLGAFRFDMMSSAAAANVPSREQQPLCREGWGVQCELYAVMLEDQISTRHPPKVKLYWYEGTDAWGFDRWKDLPEAHSGWLARATDTDALIYRSSYDTAPDAVIPQSVREGLDSPVVQYMIEIFYTTVDPKSGATSQRSRLVDVQSGEWEVPEWYSPIDYNTDPDYGRNEHFSCFCILDDIAPGWAWINEVNILGELDRYGYNTDRNCQFVEIAAPVTADLSGWKIQMIQTEIFGSQVSVLTNTVAVFGSHGLSPTKTKNSVSNYVFHVVANPSIGGDLDRSIFDPDGTLDGTWKFDQFGNGYLFNSDNTLSDIETVGVRLLRPNGIVEHEIMTIGEDILGGSYSPSNQVEAVNRTMKPGKFFVPGEDRNYGDHSVGVINGMGEGYTGNWNNTMMRTPGRINEDQQINPEIPVPYGEMIYIYSELDQSGGLIEQWNDSAKCFTNDTLRFFIKRDSIVGTNLVFKVEPWYEIDYCRQTSGGKTVYFDVSNGFDKVAREVRVTIGKGCSNNVNVVTKARVDRQLAEYEVDENNPYTPAIIKWLQDGSTLKRGGFANNDGIIRLGEFWGRKSGYIADLTLTEMYWLDMDPTAGEMVLRGGWSDAPHPVVIPGEGGRAAVTNDKMSVFMMITNKTEDVTSKYYAQAWTPYVLRSVEPTKTSWDYESGSTSDWTSVTFKIKGIILNGHTSLDNPDNWVDLRWFVFHEDSFHQPGNELGAEPYTADVEILDPVHRHDSPGYDAGWVNWVNDPANPDHADKRPYYRWDINTRLKPKEIEVLKTNNVTLVTQP